MISRQNVPHFVVHAAQFKSLEKLRLLAELLERMEVEFGIHECKIEVSDCFICHWISDEQIEKELKATGMERVVAKCVLEMRANHRALTGRKRSPKRR